MPSSLQLDSKPDFVLVTALPEERDALLDRLPKCLQLPPVDDDIRTYFQVDLPITFPDCSTGSYRIIVMCLPGMGRVQAATATADAIRRWRPRYVILVGIAGGIGVQIGDILISDQIVDYELQKLTSQSSEIRWDIHRTDPRLLDACHNFRSETWLESIKVRRPTKGKPARHTGPIASGDKVIAFGEILTTYRTDWPKLIGVEMEAAGVAIATFQSSDAPGFFMVRGVSDLADENKRSSAVKKWRAYACAVAASFTVEFLRNGPVPLSEKLGGLADKTVGSLGDNRDLSPQSGGVNIEAGRDAHIGGDVVGRDSISSTQTINTGGGAYINVIIGANNNPDLGRPVSEIQSDLFPLQPDVAVEIQFHVPHRKYIQDEYVGRRHQYYEGSLQENVIVSIWGKAGVGKTWLAAKLAIDWEKQDLSRADGKLRSVFWHDCQIADSFDSIVHKLATFLHAHGQPRLSTQLREMTEPVRLNPDIVREMIRSSLAQGQYLICLDNFDHVRNDTDLVSLMNDLDVYGVGDGGTRLILISWKELELQHASGRQLEPMTEADISHWFLKMRRYGHKKRWLTPQVAAGFSAKIYDLLKQVSNLGWIERLIIKWMRANTTENEARDRLNHLTREDVIKALVDDGDPAEVTLWGILRAAVAGKDRQLMVDTPLENIVEPGALLKLAASQGLNPEHVEAIIKDWGETGLLTADWNQLELGLNKVTCDLAAKLDLQNVRLALVKLRISSRSWLTAANHYWDADLLPDAVRLIGEHVGEVLINGQYKALQTFVAAATEAVNASDYLIHTWLRLIKSELLAWLGNASAARSEANSALNLMSHATGPVSEVQYLEARLRRRIGTYLASSNELGEVKQGLDELEQSAQLIKNLDSDPVAVHFNYAEGEHLLRALYNLGQARRKLADRLSGVERAIYLEQALVAYDECVSESARLLKPDRQAYWSAWGLVGASQVYDSRDLNGDWERAMAELQSARDNFQHVGLLYDRTFVDYELGFNYLKRFQFDVAATHLINAKKGAEDCKDNELIFLTNTELAKIRLATGDVQSARSGLKEARKTMPSSYKEYLSLLEKWVLARETLAGGNKELGGRLLLEVLGEFEQFGEDYKDCVMLIHRNLEGLENAIVG